MGIRGELFTTEVILDNRSYFFNVKENRTGDVFLQVVESKKKDGEKFDRQAIVVFEDDMQKFLRGLDASLKYIEKERTKKTKEMLEKKADAPPRKKIYRKAENTGAERGPVSAAKPVRKVRIIPRKKQ